MDEKPKHAKRSRWPAVVTAIVLILPPAYVASYGPVSATVPGIYTCGGRIVQARYEVAFDWVYAPLWSVASRCPPFGSALSQYSSWCCDLLDPEPIFLEGIHGWDRRTQHDEHDDDVESLMLPDSGIRTSPVP